MRELGQFILKMSRKQLNHLKIYEKLRNVKKKTFFSKSLVFQIRAHDVNISKRKLQ